MSHTEAVARKVTVILAAVLRRKESEIAPTDHLVADLGADSVAMIEIAISIEDEFGVTLDGPASDAIHTVADLAAWAARHSA